MTDSSPLASPAAPVTQPGARFLGALLAAAKKRHEDVLVSVHEPPLTVAELPGKQSGVLIVERGALSGPQLGERLERLLAGHAQGVLFLVLVGGTAQDRPVLLEVDRKAPHPDRLGIYHLDDGGRLERICGRKLGLLGALAHGALAHPPLSPGDIEQAAREGLGHQQDAVRFASALGQRPQWTTRLLGAACIAYFALSMVWSNHNLVETLVRMGANSRTLVIIHGEAWRLVTHAFLHGGIAHLLLNLVALFSFGGFLEPILGWRRYLLLYFATAVAGGLASVWPGGVEVSVGASGAIWGLMAAGVALMSPSRRLVPRVVIARLRPRLLFILVINAGFSLLPLVFPDFPRIDLHAHFGGGLVGYLLVASGLLLRGLPEISQATSAAPPDPRGLRVAAILVVVAMAGSLALTLALYRPWISAALPGGDVL